MCSVRSDGRCDSFHATVPPQRALALPSRYPVLPSRYPRAAPALPPYTTLTIVVGMIMSSAEQEVLCLGAKLASVANAQPVKRILSVRV